MHLCLRPLLTVAAVTALCLAASAGAQAASPDSTVLLSRPAGLDALLPGLVAGSASESVSAGVNRSATNVSHDGRLVAFSSTSDGISNEDDDRFENVYVKDTITGAVTLVSRASGAAGAAAGAGSEDPSISADGTAVAFTTLAALDPADVNGREDVYVRYLESGVTTLVSRADGANGAIGDGFAESPSISADGELVAFESSSSNLGDGDTNSADDVHVRHIASGHTELVSRASGAGGAIANAPSVEPALSGDGTKVAFRTAATNLDTTYDTNGQSDVYRRDLATDATVLISRGDGVNTPAGNAWSTAPAIDADGTHVAFETSASNLHAADPNATSDIHVRAVDAGTTVPVSRANGLNGAIGNSSSRGPAISADGDAVAFSSTAANLADGDSDFGADIHVRRIVAGETLLASRASGPGGAGGDADSLFAALSGDGSRAAFESHADNLSPVDDDDFQHVYLRDLGGEQALIHVARPAGSDVPLVGGVNESREPSSSADGRYVAFSSHSDSLFDSRARQVFVKDTVTGELTLVSRANGLDGAAANGTAERPQISADGSRVLFIARASNLAAGTTNFTSHAYVRDLEAGTTELVSRRPDGSIASASSATLSGDGQVAAFATWLDLVPSDTGGDLDVYVRDLRTGAVELANRVNGASGAEGNAESSAPSLDHDGDRVAFVSAASNLGDGDSDGDDDIHVRDLTSGETLYASRADGASGAEGDDGSYTPTISADGTRVGFASSATNLGDGDTDNGSDMHVRDLAAGRTLLGSANSAGQPTVADAHQSAALSADGRHVIFATVEALDPADGNGVLDIYERDLDSGAVKLVSRTHGAGGASGNAAGFQAALDADGSCVAFASRATNLVTNGYASPDFTQIYQRSVAGECGGEPGGSSTGAGATGTGPGAGFGDGPPADATAPVVSRFFATRARFRVGRRATPVTAAAGRLAAGTTLRYRLSEPARVTLKIERRLPGRRVGARCVAPAPRLRTKPRCTRVVHAGRLVRSGRTGANAIFFSGRVGKRALPAGRYQVTLAATDTAGNRSRPARLRLAIAR